MITLFFVAVQLMQVTSFTPSIYAGSFQLPKFDFPWSSSSNEQSNNEVDKISKQLSAGDKIVVFGGTGGVGQLVTKKLGSEGFDMRVAARNTERASETLNDDSIQTVPLDLTMNFVQEDLENALEGASAAVISLGTTAFPTQKWKDGNTPSAIDRDAVTKIANAASNVETLKKVVLVTSVGVNRIKEMPFLFLNLFGVLDCKRDGEDAVIASSKNKEAAGGGFDCVIIRPGRLVGGPYTNLDVAKLLQIEGGAENGVTVEVGDQLLGDCKRDALAETVVQCLINDECKDIDFSIISNEDPALTSEEWTKQFVTLKEKKLSSS
mmetsp:Transcript_27141/g.33528  ORF Transcript_27141/g.33528 Transcript_27141/m.33528 type:complete len:322 (-) Transcript_27141:88-1053(-)